jgi:predicted RNase H-like HicB family nuclease
MSNVRQHEQPWETIAEAKASLERDMELTAVLTPAPEGGFVALNPETGSTSQGETIEEAVANLREATTLYLEEFPLPASAGGRAVVTTFAVPEHA